MKQYFSRKLFLIIFLVMMPVATVYLVANQLLELSEKDRLISTQKELKRKLISIAEKASPNGFYFQLFTDLFRKIKHAGSNVKAIKQAAYQCQHRYQAEFLIYPFDEQGKILKLSGLTQPNSFIYGKLWDILAETSNYKPGIDEEKQYKRLQLLLGLETHAGRIKGKEGLLISLEKMRQKGFLFWQKFSRNSKAGVIILAMPRIATSVILNNHFKNESSDKFDLTFWNYELNSPLFLQTGEFKAQYVKKNLEKSTNGFFLYASRQWCILKTDLGIFIGSMPFDDKGIANKRGLLNLCFFIFTILLAAAIFHGQQSFQKMYIRMGSKLSALLIFAITIPVAALSLTGILAISDHEKVLLSRMEKEQKQRMAAIEEEFISEENSFLDICMSLRSKVLNRFSLPELTREMQGYIDRGKLLRAELRGLDGDVVRLLKTGNDFDDLENLHDGFFRFLIQDRLKQRLQNEGVVVKNPPSGVLTDVFQSIDFGFVQIAASPQRVHTFQFGHNELFWFWSEINIPGHPVAMISLHQATEKALENFLKRVLKASYLASEKFGVYNFLNQNWLKGSRVNKREANDLVVAAKITGQPASGQLFLPEGRFVAMVFPSSILHPYAMVRLISYDEIAMQQRRLSLALLSGILLIFFVALAIAKLLTRTLLEPINELDRGIRKIQEKAFDVRVEIDSGDEFGELGDAFNLMAADLKEMQMAKVVQESLFPQEKPQIKGFDTEIFNLTATDLGGDYCDVIQVSQHEWLLVIGDVSGHGTPAALAMAMVKAAIFKACREGLEFSQLPGALSSILLRTLERKKMMTMLFVLLDYSTGSVQFINAGHNWPLILRKDGKLDEICVQGMPLGVRDGKRPRQAVSQRLELGDVLFCYTDALVESRSPDNQLYGHPRLYEELGRLQGMSAQQIIQNIEAGWWQYLAGGIREDDLTMLVVKNIQTGTKP